MNKIVEEMKAFVAIAKKESLPDLDVLQRAYTKATEDYDTLYSATTNIIRKEQGWDDIIRECLAIVVMSPGVEPKNPIELTPLYIQAGLLFIRDANRN